VTLLEVVTWKVKSNETLMLSAPKFVPSAPCIQKMISIVVKMAGTISSTDAKVDLIPLHF
jgi:hypothetical protein